MIGFINKLIISVLRVVLKLRYKITVEGAKLEEDPTKAKLFIGNLTSELDPLLILVYILKKHNTVAAIPRKLLNISYLFKLYKMLPVIFTPQYGLYLHYYQKKQIQKLVEKLSDISIKKKSDLLIFPSGRLKVSEKDAIKNPLLYELIKQNPGFTPVLVKVNGMWGSAFSNRQINISIKPISSIFACILTILKNFIFFMPKRKVVISLEKIDLKAIAETNLDNFNENFQHLFQKPYIDDKGNNLSQKKITPHFYWKKLEAIDERDTFTEIEEEVISKIAKLGKLNIKDISLLDDLYMDLNLNSLDITELIIFLEERFGRRVDFSSLNKVKDICIAAVGKEDLSVESNISFQTWDKIENRKEVGFDNSKTIIEQFLRTCDRMGNAIACAEKDDVLSYPRMKSLVLGFAQVLEDVPGKMVGVMLPSSSLMNALVLALLLVNKIPVMLNWTLGIHHIESIIKQTDLKTIFVLDYFMAALDKYNISEFLQDRIVTLEQQREKLTFTRRKKAIRLSRENADYLLRYFSTTYQTEDDPAVIMFTSGTENEPKGVILSHKNILSNQRVAIKPIELDKSDSILGILPPFHIFGFSITNLLPLLCGCRAVFQSDVLNIRESLEFIYQFKVKVVCTTPTLLKALLSVADDETIKSVRLFIVGAEKAPKSLFELGKTFKTPFQIIEGYGVTECSPIITLNKINMEKNGVGYPLEDVRVEIADPKTFDFLSPNKEGLVFVSGPNVFKGYLNSNTSPFYKKNDIRWYITGDMGYLDDENALHLTGRISRFIKIGGEMISLPKIEQIFTNEFAKDKSKILSLKLAVLAREEEEKRPEIVLFINTPLELQEANEIIKMSGLSNLYRLNEVKIVDIPVLPTGKVNYQKLKKMLD